MKFLSIICLFSFLTFFSCDILRGPAGPAGPQGEQGEKGEKGDPGEIDSWTRSGILYSSDKIEDENYWDLKYIDLDDLTVTISDTIIVNCWVRKGPGYMWTEPTWYHSDWYVRIFDDDNADPGDEFIINIIVL